jgi:hypothetical protein
MYTGMLFSLQVVLSRKGGGTVDAMEVDGAMPEEEASEEAGPSQAAAAGQGGTGLADLDFSSLKPQHRQLRSKKEREALDKQLKEVRMCCSLQNLANFLA